MDAGPAGTSWDDALATLSPEGISRLADRVLVLAKGGGKAHVPHVVSATPREALERLASLRRVLAGRALYVAVPPSQAPVAAALDAGVRDLCRRPAPGARPQLAALVDRLIDAAAGFVLGDELASHAAALAPAALDAAPSPPAVLAERFVPELATIVPGVSRELFFALLAERGQASDGSTLARAAAALGTRELFSQLGTLASRLDLPLVLAFEPSESCALVAAAAASLAGLPGTGLVVGSVASAWESQRALLTDEELELYEPLDATRRFLRSKLQVSMGASPEPAPAPASPVAPATPVSPAPPPAGAASPPAASPAPAPAPAPVAASQAPAPVAASPALAPAPVGPTPAPAPATLAATVAATGAPAPGPAPVPSSATPEPASPAAPPPRASGEPSRAQPRLLVAAILGIALAGALYAAHRRLEGGASEGTGPVVSASFTIHLPVGSPAPTVSAAPQPNPLAPSPDAPSPVAPSPVAPSPLAPSPAPAPSPTENPGLAELANAKTPAARLQAVDHALARRDPAQTIEVVDAILREFGTDPSSTALRCGLVSRLLALGTPEAADRLVALAAAPSSPTPERITACRALQRRQASLTDAQRAKLQALADEDADPVVKQQARLALGQ